MGEVRCLLPYFYVDQLIFDKTMGLLLIENTYFVSDLCIFMLIGYLCNEYLLQSHNYYDFVMVANG